MRTSSSRTSSALFVVALLLAAGAAGASVITTPTTDTDKLATSLRPRGLTIDSVVIRSGVPGQIGTYANFELAPVTIRPGIVLSSGDVTNLGPLAEAQDPAYDPSSPPAVVNSPMSTDTVTYGGTPEFDAYGLADNHIQNFSGSYDVAAVEVRFTLDHASPIKFDFVFGSVEFPYWTSQYTDAFIVFLDGTDPVNQICFDANGSPVQVGSSFAGLETTADLNTAFASPHALIHHLTTTSVELDAGPHTLIFEVGDVNDQILDSAVFITGLRAEAGNPGTDPTEDTCRIDFNADGVVNPDDIADYIGCFFTTPQCPTADWNGDGFIDPDDLSDYIGAFFEGC